MRIYFNSISILHLPQLIQFNAFVQPIKLPSRGDILSESLAVVSGFGQVSDDNRINANALKYANVRILDLETCRRVFYGNLVNENSICTSGDNGLGACHSDYGGPLVVKRNNEDVLIGVISFGWPICSAGKPSVYADVQKYLNWIETVANIAN